MSSLAGQLRKQLWCLNSIIIPFVLSCLLSHLEFSGFVNLIDLPWIKCQQDGILQWAVWTCTCKFGMLLRPFILLWCQVGKDIVAAFEEAIGRKGDHIRVAALVQFGSFTHKPGRDLHLHRCMGWPFGSLCIFSPSSPWICHSVWLTGLLRNTSNWLNVVNCTELKSM